MSALPSLDKELLAKIKSIQIHAKYLVNDAFAGEYESAFRGRGMAFEEVREYHPGDDIRTIDWNVTARTGKAHVKVFREERELTVLFVVDISASSLFGTVKRFKNEVAAEVTALLAYTALRNNDKVGLIVFSDHVEHYLPPKKGRAHIWRVIRDILTYRPQSRKTDFKQPIEFLNRVIKRKAVTFLVSDFQGGDFEKDLRSTARHHEMIAISIHDPRERELPRIGFVELEDSETGEVVLIDTGSSKLLSDFSKSAQKSLEAQRRLFQTCRIESISLSTSEPYVDPIIRFFRGRERSSR